MAVYDNNLLPVDGEVYFVPNFIREEEADILFSILKTTINWKQEPIKIMGKEIMQPRLTALYGESGRPYRYSGISLEPLPFTNELVRLKEMIEDSTALSFTTVLLNYYRDGKDSMGWHRDNEKSLGPNPAIASISFGATRNFKLKHVGDPTLQLTIPLTHGSLLLMKGTTQHLWYHSIPKQLKINGERINLTFRNIVDQ